MKKNFKITSLTTAALTSIILAGANMNNVKADEVKASNVKSEAISENSTATQNKNFAAVHTKTADKDVITDVEKQNAVKITATLGDTSTLKPGDGINEYYKLIHVKAGNKELLPHDNYSSELLDSDGTYIDDEPMKAGYHYKTQETEYYVTDIYDYPDRTPEGMEIFNLDPNTVYKYTAPDYFNPDGKEKYFRTDDEGYILKQYHDYSDFDDDDNYGGGVYLNFNYEFVPGQHWIDLSQKRKEQMAKDKEDGLVRYIPDRWQDGEIKNAKEVTFQFDDLLQKHLVPYGTSHGTSYGTSELRVKWTPELTLHDLQEFANKHAKLLIDGKEVKFDSSKIGVGIRRQTSSGNYSFIKDFKYYENVKINDEAFLRKVLPAKLDANTWYQWKQTLRISDAVDAIPKEIAERVSQKTLIPGDLYQVGYKTDDNGSIPTIALGKDKNGTLLVSELNSEAGPTVKLIISNDADAIEVPHLSDSNDNSGKNDTNIPNIENNDSDTSSVNNPELNNTSNLEQVSPSDNTAKESTSNEKKDDNKITNKTKSSNVKFVLSHNAYVYDKSGKAYKNKKYGFNILLHKYQGIKPKNAKLVTIKGKKYYQIGKNKFIKADNVRSVPATKTLKNKTAHTENVKIAYYNEKGKRVKTVKLNKKRNYKLLKQKWIKNHLYYQIKDGKQTYWIRSNSVKIN